MGFLWGGKTKKCVKCKREIDAYAEKCPYCWSKQGDGFLEPIFARFGCLGGTIIIIITIIIMGVIDKKDSSGALTSGSTNYNSVVNEEPLYETIETTKYSDDNLPVISNNKIDYNDSREYDTKDVVKYDNESLPDITYGNNSGEKSHSEGFVNNDDVSISNNEVNNETINNIEEEERVVEETSESTLSKKEARQQKKEDRKSDRQRRKENSKKESDGE